MEIVFYIGFTFSIGSMRFIVTNIQGTTITFRSDSGVEQQYDKYVLQSLLLFSNEFRKEGD